MEVDLHALTADEAEALATELLAEESLTAATFSAEDRRKLAKEGQAMPDGSFPIRNRSDLENAIHALGRAANPEKAKAWIRKRARELKAEDLLPDSWKGMTAASWEEQTQDSQGEDNRRYAAELCPTCGQAMPEKVAMSADASPLAAVLAPVLASVVAEYLSAHGAHWNVTGDDFAEYHELFGEIYEDVLGSVDPLAENILKLGGRAPMGLQQMAALSAVPDVRDTLEPGSLAAQLSAQNDAVLGQLQDAFKVANSLDEQGVANFLAERIDAHQKWRWQLNASLGRDATGDEQLVPEDDEYGSMTASAAGMAPEVPPSEWFEVPEPDEPVPLTITADGQVYGHAWLWNSCHTGYPGRCTTAPRSRSGYKFFHLGATETADGKTYSTGKITFGAGHAPLTASRSGTAAHYDNTAHAGADVVVRDGKLGGWVAGALRPGLPARAVKTLKAAALSGDWRSVNGALELIGLLAVNVPGFPVPRAQALVSSAAEEEVEPADWGEAVPDEPVITLVAAGIVLPCEPCEQEAALDDLLAPVGLDLLLDDVA